MGGGGALGKHAVPSDFFITSGASLGEIGLSEMSLGERKAYGVVSGWVWPQAQRVAYQISRP